MNLPAPLFRRIAEDREHGSRELLERLLSGLLDWSASRDAIDPGTTEDLCHRIADVRPSMASFTTVAALLYRRMEDENEVGMDDLHSVLESLLERLRTSVDRIAEGVRDAGISDRSIMVFSRSGSVMDLLERLSSLSRIVVLHAYPGGEGVSVARDLHDGHEVHFAYDAEAGGLLQEVDALYLGADAIRVDGTVLNKTGSRLLARAADPVPVRVVADMWKVTRTLPSPEAPSLSSPDGVPADLVRRHPLFEPVPPGRIDTYMTDRGVLGSADQIRTTCRNCLRARRSFRISTD